MTGPDTELVELVAEGQLAAYGELYRRHIAVARRYSRALTRCPADAEDLVADAFASVLSAIRRGYRPVHFRAYLLTAIQNRECDRVRRRQRFRIVDLRSDLDTERPLLGIPAPDGDPAEKYADVDLARQAFRALPPRWRQVLWLSAVEGRSTAELAPLLNLSENASAALACRARQGLRRGFAELANASFALSCTRRRVSREHSVRGR